MSPVPYPTPVINGSVDILRYTNLVTGGAMSTLFLVACSVILLFLFKSKLYKTSSALAASLLLTMVMGSFLWALGQLEGNMLMVFVVSGIGATLWSIFDGG